MFTQSSNHTVTLAHPNSDGVVGGLGADGRPAPTCLHFPLPASCSSLLVLLGKIDGNGSLKQALLTEEEESCLGQSHSDCEAGRRPFLVVMGCLGDAEVWVAFPRKMR